MELRLKDYSQKIKGALPGDIVWIGNEPFIYLEEKEEERDSEKSLAQYVISKDISSEGVNISGTISTFALREGKCPIKDTFAQGTKEYSALITKLNNLSIPFFSRTGFEYE